MSKRLLGKSHLLKTVFFCINLHKSSETKVPRTSSLLRHFPLNMTTLSFNPGVGLKLTAPRIQDNSRPSSAGTPSPQSYSLKGTLDVTDREKNQNELLSKRYERKSIGSRSTFTTNAPSKCRPSRSVDFVWLSSGIVTSRARNRATSNNNVPSEYYSIRGMTDLTEREVSRNELISNRYPVKA